MVGDALYEAIAVYLDRRMASAAAAAGGNGAAVVLGRPAVRHPAVRKAR